MGNFCLRLRLGCQDILLMGMGFRNKQRWENETPLPSGPSLQFPSCIIFLTIKPKPCKLSTVKPCKMSTVKPCKLSTVNGENPRLSVEC